MKTAEYKLFVDATESRVARNESDFYTLRLPMGMLRTQDPDLAKVLTDTAEVAFDCNRPGSRKLVVTCPEGDTEAFSWIKEALSQFDVELAEQPGTRFVTLAKLKACSLGCVDRRLDDTGVDPISREGQITHAGGPLVLDPRLKDEMPTAHWENLSRALGWAAESDAPVGNINYHFGAEGSSGCGMYGVLSRSNAAIREILKGPEDIFHMMNRVRDRYGRILSTDCRITGSVILGSKDSVTYDLDDPAEREALLSEKKLVL